MKSWSAAPRSSAPSKLAIAALLVAGASPAFAATQVGDYLTFSGFGTLGGVRTNTDAAEFKLGTQTGGADRSGSLDVDSDLGLQLTATATPWLSGTVQMLSIDRSKTHLTNEVEWAYLKLKPVEGLSVRAGRMALPMFAVSDSRYVGYANNWLRTPGEVYGLALLSRLEGVDVTYAAPIGSTTLTGTAIAGKSSVPASTATYKASQLHGLNLTWETEWATFRLGQVSDLYIGRNQSMTLFDQPESAPIRADYYKKLTGRDPSQVKAMWSRLTFTGKGMPPKELADGAAVKKAVAADPKAVGYIDKSEVDGTVKVLQTIN